MNMTVSIFKAFLACPAKAMAMYHGRVLGDFSIDPAWEDEGSRAMACGALLDAIVTRGYQADPDESVTVAGVYPNFRSSYDDGIKNATHLVNRSGGWNAYAKQTIAAAKRLMSDPVARRLVDASAKQVKVRWQLGGFDWSGDIDLLGVIGGTLYITDLKHPASVEDGWIVSCGKNVKAPWQDVWSYWFQLAAYRYGIQTGTLEGCELDPSSYGDIRQGLLYATNSEPSEIGYIPVSDQTKAFVAATSHRTLDGRVSKLDAIRAIVEGKADAGRCGKCDYCRATSRVQIPEADGEGDFPPPLFADEWGMNFTEI